MRQRPQVRCNRFLDRLLVSRLDHAEVGCEGSGVGNVEAHFSGDPGCFELGLVRPGSGAEGEGRAAVGCITVDRSGGESFAADDDGAGVDPLDGAVAPGDEAAPVIVSEEVRLIRSTRAVLPLGVPADWSSVAPEISPITPITYLKE